MSNVHHDHLANGTPVFKSQDRVGRARNLVRVPGKNSYEIPSLMRGYSERGAAPNCTMMLATPSYPG